MLALAGVIPGAAVLTEGGRAKALFQDPNVFGPFLVPAAADPRRGARPAAAARLSASRRRLLLAVLRRSGCCSPTPAGAWLNLARRARRHGRRARRCRGGARQALALLAIGLVGAVVVAGAVVATGSADFLAERARPQTYDTTRFAGQRAGLAAGQAVPVRRRPRAVRGDRRISAHSTTRAALGEQGFLGLLVSSRCSAPRSARRFRNAARGRDTYGIGSAALLAAWCGLLANSAFIDTLHWRHLWLVAGLIWAGTMLGTARRGCVTSPSRAPASTPAASSARACRP